MPNENLNAQQLEMFIPAKRLHGPEFGKGDSGLKRDPEANQQQWERFTSKKKVHNAHTGGAHGARRDKRDGSSLLDSVRESGVQTPVKVDPDFGNHPNSDKAGRSSALRGGKVIFNGHHRLASANRVNPDMEVPVEYEVF
jgi:hypothetical protein